MIATYLWFSEPRIELIYYIPDYFHIKNYTINSHKQKSPTLGEAEYVWRYNHRNDNIENQKILILKQLESQHL